MILTTEQVNYTYDKEIGNILCDIWQQTNNKQNFLIQLERYVKETPIIYVVPFKTGRWPSLSCLIGEEDIYSLSREMGEIFKLYKEKIFYHNWNGEIDQWVSHDDYFNECGRPGHVIG